MAAGSIAGSAHHDVIIAGAGIIGLSLALDLTAKGVQVTVLDRGEACGEASRAAAGMLAAYDAANPAELRSLSDLSLKLYPGFLQTVQQLSGHNIPFETNLALEACEVKSEGEPLPWEAPTSATFRRIEEQSLNPRKLSAALPVAARTAGIALLEHAAVTSVHREANNTFKIEIDQASGPLTCNRFVDCTGAWSRPFTRPSKGQMLRLQLDEHLPRVNGHIPVVVRNTEVYIVPRLDGSAVIGATVEDAGFDTAVTQDTLDLLRRRAAQLLPAVAGAPCLESWAGLRPATPDFLPVLGSISPGHFVATGHFRNGILLAPATARVLTHLILGEASPVDLSDFSPRRFPASVEPQ